MATLRDGSAENRESFEKAKAKRAQEHPATAQAEKKSTRTVASEHKDERYAQEEFENEKKEFEGE